MVTQKQIAEYTGYDQRTVSQALNNKGRIAVATRNKIMQAAMKLGYRPNFSAQAIRGGVQNRIGLFLGLRSRLSDLPAARLQGMQLAALEAGVGLNICTFPDQAFDNENELGRFLGSFGVDGMLVNYEQDSPQQLIRILSHFNIPAVSLNNRLMYDCVYHDNNGIAAQAVEALHKGGFSEILYVGYGPRKIVEKNREFLHEHYSAAERREGVIQTARKLKLNAREIEISAMVEGIYWLEKLKKKKIRPAIICYTELTAQRVMVELLSKGYKLPDDALVVYFGRSSFIDDTLDSLMRVLRLPELKMGQEAVKLLMQKIETGEPVRGLGLRCEQRTINSILSTESYIKPAEHESFKFPENLEIKDETA